MVLGLILFASPPIPNKVFMPKKSLPSDPNSYISSALLRKQMYADLSSMYGSEVPLYDKLLETNREINSQVAREHPEWSISDNQLDQISAERHGAIRLGKPEELNWISRFFAVLGMFPVNFYNLADAGAKSQPILGTAFRPLENPDQRMFCSLLVTDYFDSATRKKIEKALEKRAIISTEMKELIEIHEQQNGLTCDQATAFRTAAKKLLGWSGKAFNYPLYRELCDQGFSIAADIACFPNPHLNHLTPNSLDIDRLYLEMKKRLGDANYYKKFSEKGMKDSIEGPPPPLNPDEALVFLRQTAYKALPEEVRFETLDGQFDRTATHTARFGEIEQRGVAMTPKGRLLYDAAIKKAEAIDPKFPQENYTEYMHQYRLCFQGIPKTHAELQKQGLAYYSYSITEKGREAKKNGQIKSRKLDDLIENGFVSYTPIRYEDFLPVSAAGIFAANLNQYGTKSTAQSRPIYTKEHLENAMGKKIWDSNELYAAQQDASLQEVQRNIA